MNKKIINLIGVVSISAPMFVVVSCSSLSDPKSYFKTINLKGFVKNETEIKSAYDLLDNNSTNIYFSPAMYPWSYMLKHAVLSKNKTIIAPITYSNTWESFQRKFNKDTYLKFKNDEKLESEVWSIKSSHDFEEQVIKYVKSHKKEKINIFGNAWWFPKNKYTDKNTNKKYNFYDLISLFPNVRLSMIEDGSNNLDYYLNNQDNNIMPALNRKHISKNLNFVDHYSMLNQKNNNLFLPNDIKKISDALFNTRDSKHNRLYNIYNKISGFDYTEGLKILKELSKNGKNSLLILGGYDSNNYYWHEKEFVLWIYNKYNAKYNIFYKGHPGHSWTTDNILKSVDNGETNTLKQKVHLLNAFIPSEEYTNHHIDEGMKFDKFIAAGGTGALTKVADGSNGFNNYDDIIGYWKNTSDSFSGKLDVWPVPKK